jgi:SAM-dependent methyltransferase
MPDDRPLLARLFGRWWPHRAPDKYAYASLRLSRADIDREAYKEHLGGGAETWDGRGRFQVLLLQALGLQPGQRLLDAGCGPLRAGVHLIDHLDAGRYCGIDFNRDFIRVARELVAGDARLRDKSPRLERLDSFAFHRLRTTFDWVLAFSVLNHCTKRSRRLFFRNVQPAMATGATLVITHARWLDPAEFAAGPLRIVRMLEGPDDVEPGLDVTAWGFAPPPEGQMFPIAVLARR